MNEISDKSKNKIKLSLFFLLIFKFFLKVWNFWLKSKEKKN